MSSITMRPVGLVYKERFFWVIRKGSFSKKERFLRFFWKKGKVLFGRILEKGKVLFCKRKGSFLQKPEKERFFLEKGNVLLGHKERFFLHIFHTGKVFFDTKKLSLAFLVRRPITEERFLVSHLWTY